MRPHAGDDERLVYEVIGAFYEVYNRLEFGFFESVYANALEVELKSRGHTVEREVAVCVSYKQHAVGRQRLDMVIDGRLIVETKASQDLPKSAMRQVYSYLKGTALPSFWPEGTVLPPSMQPPGSFRSVIMAVIRCRSWW